MSFIEKIKKYFLNDEADKHICEVEPLSAELIDKYKHLGSWNMERKCKICGKKIIKYYIV